MKYTAKHICRLLGINRETLRYYEKEGLLHPEIDENNRYRYFDDWEINYILEIFQYRNLGFSIEEVRSLFEKDTLDEYIQKMESRRCSMQNEIRCRELAIERSSEFLTSLRMIPCRMGTYELIYHPAIYTVPLRKNYDLFFSEQYADVYPLVLKNYEFFENTVHIRQEDFRNSTGRYTWGFGIEERWAEALKLDTGAMDYVPEQLCIRTVIDAGERWNFNYNLFADALRFIHADHLEPDGDIIGYLTARIHDNNKYCRFIEAYFPVKKTS